MKITTTKERIFVLKEVISQQQAEGRAWEKKMNAFGSISKITSFFQQSKDEDFELIYKEHRFEPFWHVVCKASYVYERRNNYTLPIKDKAVEAITVEWTKYEVLQGAITVHGLDHCRENLEQKVFIEGRTGEQSPHFENYLQFPATELSEKKVATFAPKNSIVVTPEIKSSAIVREILAGIIKGIEADKILEEYVHIEQVDLYYRPIYAFQYHWKSKNKKAVLECDALTGKLHAAEQTFENYVGKVLDPKFLFDLGVDAVDLLVPGGGIAVKLAQKGIGMTKGKKK